jgi:hypothetical protein
VAPTCPDCGFPHGPETGVRGELVEEEREGSAFAHDGDRIRCEVCGRTNERADWDDAGSTGAFVWLAGENGRE